MLKCNQVTRLVAAEEYQDLGLMKKMEFRLHLMMCSHCNRYVDQIKRLGSGARERAKSLVPDEKQLQRMEKNIQEDLNKSGE